MFSSQKISYVMLKGGKSAKCAQNLTEQGIYNCFL